MTAKGAVAAGHPETAKAAAAVLEEGGNAFDAALAGICAACVAEPILASLGGGGFLIARRAGGEPVLYDFFAHTPMVLRKEAEIDFHPIVADFGGARQEFHMGLGSAATPGMVRGLFDIHRDLASMPMARLVEPAQALARAGVRVNRLQAYIFDIVKPIYTSNQACRAIFGSREKASAPVGEGEVLAMPELADAFEILAREGEAPFHEGEIAQRLVEDCRNGGGHLTGQDLAAYRTVRRVPLALSHGDARLYTNPPPSSGGILIAFALRLLAGTEMASLGFGSAAHLGLLARTMAMTNRARVEAGLHEAGEEAAARAMLDPGLVARYRKGVLGRPSSPRGTTHIGVIDARGNSAGMTVTNGEGCGHILPGTGIMLNNLLGEEDINPHGFHRWPADTRLSSMMAPTLVDLPGSTAVIGSGGSNRIRTAILQVLINLLEFGMTVEEAVLSPRIHFEDGLLSIESGFASAELKILCNEFPDNNIWKEKNLFFGGAHSLCFDAAAGVFDGAGDPRRGGVVITV